MIDRVTYFVYLLNNPFLDWLAKLIDSDAFLVMAIACMMAIFERKERNFERISKILFTVFLAYILAEGLKNVFALERPCVSEIRSKIPCPQNFSFPSGHVLIPACVMFAYLKRREFVFFWFLTILVAFTRMYLGVHTLVDVAGSIAMAPLVFHISNILLGWVFGIKAE